MAFFENTVVIESFILPAAPPKNITTPVFRKDCTGKEIR